MATMQKINESDSGDAFQELASATDEFERFKHPHAIRIGRIADEIAKRFHMAARAQVAAGGGLAARPG